jgi:hypothetical protein
MAAYACPECRRPALAAARRLVLPGDRRADEIALETLSCACGFKAVGVAEQMKRVSLRETAAERVGFRLPAAAVDLLDHIIARCPDPGEEYCFCSAHALLNRRDLRDRWNLLQSFAPFAGFPLAAAGAERGAVPPVAYDPLDWSRDGEGYRAEVEGRTWRLLPPAPPRHTGYELSVGGGLGLDLDALPPFWRLAQRKEVSPRRHGDTEK